MKLVRFEVGSGFVPSTRLIASVLELFGVFLSCRKAEGAGRRYFGPGLSFTRVPVRLLSILGLLP